MVPIKHTPRSRSTRPARRAVRAGLVPALALLLAGCGNSQDDPDSLVSVSPESAAPAPSSDDSPDTSRFNRFDSQIGDLNATLSYCAPGMSANAEKSCGLDHIRSGITDDVVEPMREEIEGSPAPEEYADVSTAIDGMDETVKALKPCEDWFTSEEHESDTECGQAWSSLVSNWRDLTGAMGYGVP
ncbi:MULTISPECIES: hypothetical protein [Nocardiopsis]|uniref:Uncharacterized protein n=1 Tax=Nocardiopsis sinuspersici TaxID=501010 RepID=A0A1V3C4Y2_9ACTN|nr:MULTISPECIES: hypothetical protein [Nocardiopsis]OOC55743.1 hypothetical protein NOSIN_19495 [Nocardiopsis sinuspersici]